MGGRMLDRSIEGRGQRYLGPLELSMFGRPPPSDSSASQPLCGWAQRTSSGQTSTAFKSG